MNIYSKSMMKASFLISTRTSGFILYDLPVLCSGWTKFFKRTLHVLFILLANSQYL
jgi:hypothetical protein